MCFWEHMIVDSGAHDKPAGSWSAACITVMCPAYAFTANFLLGKAVSLLMVFSVFRPAWHKPPMVRASVRPSTISRRSRAAYTSRLGELARTWCLVRRRLIARVFLTRRSRGVYFCKGTMTGCVNNREVHATKRGGTAALSAPHHTHAHLALVGGSERSPLVLAQHSQHASDGLADDLATNT